MRVKPVLEELPDMRSCMCFTRVSQLRKNGTTKMFQLIMHLLHIGTTSEHYIIMKVNKILMACSLQAHPSWKTINTVRAELS